MMQKLSQLAMLLFFFSTPFISAASESEQAITKIRNFEVRYCIESFLDQGFCTNEFETCFREHSKPDCVTEFEALFEHCEVPYNEKEYDPSCAREQYSLITLPEVKAYIDCVENTCNYLSYAAERQYNESQIKRDATKVKLPTTKLDLEDKLGCIQSIFSIGGSCWAEFEECDPECQKQFDLLWNLEARKDGEGGKIVLDSEEYGYHKLEHINAIQLADCVRKVCDL